MNNICICIIINKETDIKQHTITYINNMMKQANTDNIILYNCIPTMNPLLNQINFAKIHNNDAWTSDNHNINHILGLAKMTNADYLWLHYIDDIIVGNIEFPVLTDDCYLLKFTKDLVYWKRRIFKLSLDWKLDNEYYGSLKTGNNITATKLTSNYYIVYDLPNYDIQHLLNTDTTDAADSFDFEFANHLFFLAKFDKAYDYYKIALIKTTNPEIKYNSLIKMGDIMLHYNDNTTNALNYYNKAHNILNHRGEAILKISILSSKNGDYETSYNHSKIGINLVEPIDDLIGIDVDTYKFKLLDEFSVAAYYMGKYQESYDGYIKLMGLDIDDDNKKRIKNNMSFTQAKINEQSAKKNIAIYLDSYVLTQENHTELVRILSKLNYNTYVANDVPQNYIIDGGIYINTNTFNKLNKQNDFFTIVLHINNCNLVVLDNDHMINKNNINILCIFDGETGVQFNNGVYVTLDDVLLDDIICEYDYVVDDENAYIRYRENCWPNETFWDNFNEEKFQYKKEPINIIKNYKSCDNKLVFNYPKYYDVNNPNEHNIETIIDIINGVKDKIKYDYKIYCLNEILGLYKLYDITKYNQLCRNIIDLNNIVLNNTRSVEEKIKMHLNNADMFIKLNDNLQAFNEYSNILKSYVLKDNEESELYVIRDVLIDSFKDRFLEYPQEKISRITTTRGGVLFTITSCKRLDLFEKTMNSFINCCNDVHLINRWICVDDNSTCEDRLRMKTLYPFIEFVYKENYQKGHVYSMNLIHDYLSHYTYLVHIEDDFHFIEQRNYISDSINILSDNKSIGQVLFNNHYAEIEPYKINIKGGIKQISSNGLVYNIHEYDENISGKKYNYINNYYWPHFSFRPSVHRCSTIIDVGLFYNTHCFEHCYALEYTERGYKSALFETFSCIHIGKKTWEQGSNSYNMNNIAQFNYELLDVNICVIKTGFDYWKSFKSRSRNVINFLRSFNTPKQCIEFVLNNKGDHKFLIFEDTANFTHNIHNKLQEILPLLVDKHFIVVGDDNSKLSSMSEHNIELIGDGEKGGVYTSSKYGFMVDHTILSDIEIDYDNFYESLIGSVGEKYILDSPLISYRRDKYLFLPNKDSMYYDLDRIDLTGLTIDQQQDVTSKYFSCTGYNTYGFYKYLIRDQDKHVNLMEQNSGLYVNEDKWVFSDGNKEKIRYKINNCIRNDGNNIINNLTFTITTCRRLDYFIETMDTFILKCQDIDFIDLWICIDDCSTEEDRQVMKTKYPFFTFIFKDIQDKGHAKSLNMLWDAVKTDYVFQYEDDWKIVNDFKVVNFFNYMKDNCDQLIFVLQKLEYTPQVAEVDGYKIVERIYNPTHKYKSMEQLLYDKRIGITEMDAYKNNKYLVDQYWLWPGFSLNPSLINFKKISAVGKFITNNEPVFEYDFASRCFMQDMKIHIVKFNIGHIGMITSYNIDRI